jgi:hypothetical protein
LNPQQKVFTVLVTGSRDWEDDGEIAAALRTLEGKTVRLLHGNARGADRMAARVAKGLGFDVVPFPCDWSVKPDTPAHRIKTRPDGSQYDAGAGLDRNLAMLDENPDLVLAFQRNYSSGTQHTIDHARGRGIDVEVYECLNYGRAA